MKRSRAVAVERAVLADLGAVDDPYAEGLLRPVDAVNAHKSLVTATTES